MTDTATKTDTSTPASPFVEFWNDVLVDKFERFRNIWMEGMSYHSRAAFEKLDLAPGAQVLDVGCGWGDTAIELAQMVGPGGSVTGIDCCDAFLDKGRRDADAAGLTNVRFIEADAERFAFESGYDFCFSRFGTLFFANPVAALRNIHGAVKPGGEIMFIAWRILEDNDWLNLPKQVVLDYLPPPGDDADHCGPGPFSMAGEVVAIQQLDMAGFADICFKRVDGPVMVGDSLEQAAAFQLAIGPAGEIVREAGTEAERRRAEIEDALRAELARYQTSGGEVVMDSSSWTITARRAAA